ncbi:MAG: MmgE/PrpD family protein [Planctomycetaceae bacterium]|nr:MmgE/PrpD family protein [Planctomycetaceae bacterium]
MPNSYRHLPRDCNQALQIGEYAIDFCRNHLGNPSRSVIERTERFHLDSVACGLSALSWGTNAPTVLRAEAFQYPREDAWGVPCFGAKQRVQPEKAVVANCAAVREWDSNGTNFGFNPARNATRGEFGHNDFYPVAIAGAQIGQWDGAQTVRAMICHDEIRGRLAEVFGLKDYKIDHVVHGGIASAAVFGALVGATAAQIESAIGMLIAHYVPFRAIRAGHQLSDSKGASAALTTEMAILSVRRSMNGFVGPADIFRNPQALFCLFEPPQAPGESPFELSLAIDGDDFAIRGMHFKIGLYEHQSAGAIQGLIELLQQSPNLHQNPDTIEQISIRIYEPAFSIIGDPAKRDPQTRQSADHSMIYIIATVLRKAHRLETATWQDLMLMPGDYSDAALHDPLTRRLMDRIHFEHGGDQFDEAYPDGIPTSIEITTHDGQQHSSGMVMYPEGHARRDSDRLDMLLERKFENLTSEAVPDYDKFRSRFSSLSQQSADAIRQIYDFEITPRQEPDRSLPA